MAKTREIACKYYEYEGCTCSKRSKECHFRKEMQTCGKYEKGHGQPARKDLRKIKRQKAIDKQIRKDFY